MIRLHVVSAYVVFTLTLVSAALTHAQPIALPVVHWQAPADCPEIEQVRVAMERWLRKAVDPMNARSLTVDARVRGEGSQWSLVLVLESPSGRESEGFNANRCETLVEVVGLKVMLAATAAAALQTLGAASTVAGSRAIGEGRGVRIGLRATGGVNQGVLPELGALMGLAAALQLAAARVELVLSYAPSRAARYAEPSSVGANFRLISGQVRGCAVPVLGPAEVPVCAGVELGALVGTGFGPQQSFSRAEAYGAVVLGPALRWPLIQHLFAWLELDGSVAFLRPEFRTRGLPGRLYQPPALGARAIAGLEWQF